VENSIIDWHSFLFDYLFMLAGITFHLLLKFVNAHEKPDYKGSIFIKKNWTNALLGWFAGTILVILMVTKSKDLGWNAYLLSLLFGYSGSSLLKNVLKMARAKFTKFIT
jgi:hypothetical protein